jgi:hypothetical protein
MRHDLLIAKLLKRKRRWMSEKNFDRNVPTYTHKLKFTITQNTQNFTQNSEEFKKRN